MVDSLQTRSRSEKRVSRRFGRAWAGVVAAGLLIAACGESSGDDADGGAGQSGSAGAGGSRAGNAGRAGTAGVGGRAGSAGNAGKGGSAGSTGGDSAGSDANGGEGDDAGAGGAADQGGTSGGGSGGSTVNEGGAGGEGSEVPSELVALAEAFCASARTCCATAEVPEVILDDCEAATIQNVYNFQLAAKGTVTINPTALAACHAAYEAAADSCLLGEVLEACRGMFVGTSPEGGPCEDALECDRSAGPRLCEIAFARDPDGIGNCVAPDRGALNAPCGGDCQEEDSCSQTFISTDVGETTLCHEADGLFCDFDVGCVELVEDGQECPDGIGCASDSTCSSTCNPRVGNGGDCFNSLDCLLGFVCNENKCEAAPFASPYVCAGTMPFND